MRVLGLLERRVMLWMAGVVLVLFATLAGCANTTTPSSGTSPVEQTVARVGTGQIAAPPCGPTIPTHGSGIGGTLSVLMPSNTQAVVGFVPLLPGQLPEGFTWNFAYLQAQTAAASTTSGVIAPWFHAGYRKATPGLKTYNPAPHSLISLDETSATLAPETALFEGATPLHALDTAPVTVNGQAASLVHLGTDTKGSRITTLAWHSGTLTLRLTATQQSSVNVYPFSWKPTVNEMPVDSIDAWSGATDATLEQIARGMSPYTGCQGK